MFSKFTLHVVIADNNCRAFCGQHFGCQTAEVLFGALNFYADQNDSFVGAKREVGKLWEDITKAPYTVLFNSATSAIKLWRIVEVMRTVDGLLKSLHSIQGGKIKLVATHGNRFILYIVCRSLANLYDEQQPPTPDAISKSVAFALNKLLDPKRKLFESSYPSNFFKNAGKCKEIATEIVGATA